MRRALAAVASLGGAVLVSGLAYQAILAGPGGPTWTAEFTNARGLVVGNDVRYDGAVVGRVTSIGLSRQGTALVRFQLSNPAAAPRVDAVAAIEPADLLGDTYLSLTPGTAPRQLHGPIAAGHTVNAPRLDELLDAFQPNVREGLRALFVEGGLALDQRGGALAQATVALRPTLQAAQGVLGELDTQDGSLARLLGPAQALATQLDSRRGDIGPLLDGLAQTLEATSSTSSSLGQSLAGLPALLRRLRDTSDGLAATAGSAGPLVRRLEPLTGQLATVTAGLPQLMDRVRVAIPSFNQVLGTARDALSAGAPGLRRLAAALPVLGAQAPGISTLLSELDRAVPGIAQGFFVDFPDQAAESGRQPFDPFADPRRAYWRGAAVFSCEAFGVPVRPGCLDAALANLGRQPPPPGRAAQQLLNFLLKR